MRRRDLLLTAPLALFGCGDAPPPAKPRIAAITSVYRPNSHADVFLHRILEGYRLNGVSHQSRLEIASMYVDQFPPEDMARDLAAEYGFGIYPTIAEALRCGGDRLAVDGVALIVEHGDYPDNEKGQKLYPRYEFFRQIIDAMRADGRTAPIYSDKHFSYDFEKARWMYDAARELSIPLMAGSTVSLTWRYPPLELAPETELEEAMVVGFGQTDAYGFHTLEALQAIVEKRRGGEVGVSSIQAIQGPKVWELADEGVWSRELLEAALARTPTRVEGDPRELVENPVLVLIEYQDGLKGRILLCNGLLRSWVFAAQPKGGGEILSTDCRIQLYLHGHWGFMARNFENLVADGKLPNPVERTLLTTGMLAFAFESLHQGGKRLETPQLAIAYSS
ncbi:MAG: hypothetical protein GC160_12335 [Acidobacteria bacterium]|nr:hypothetical protein [Acidobacteriota bacterium]